MLGQATFFPRNLSLRQTGTPIFEESIETSGPQQISCTPTVQESNGIIGHHRTIVLGTLRCSELGTLPFSKSGVNSACFDTWVLEPYRSMSLDMFRERGCAPAGLD